MPSGATSCWSAPRPTTARSTIEQQEQIPMRPDLMELFEMDELKKYFTAAELSGGNN